MKNFKLKRLLGLAFIGCLSTLGASTVFAAAGDSIDNTVYVDFDVGGVAQTTAEDTVTFVEDNLVNFTVAWVDAADVEVATGSTGQMLTFTVTNNGNGVQDFALAATDSAVAGDFSANTFSVFVESGDAPGYDPLDLATFIDDLGVYAAPGDERVVYVFADIPGGRAAGDLANVTLTATATVDVLAAGPVGGPLPDHVGVEDDATEQNVFADSLGNGLDADIAQDGVHSDDGTYVIVGATLTILKTSKVIYDPINGALDLTPGSEVYPKAITGAIVQYTIRITNDVTSSASATLTTLSDALQNLAAGSLTFDPVLVLSDLTQEDAGGGNVRIDTTNTGRASAGPDYCFADAADGNLDGCTYADPSLGLVFSDLVTPANPNIAAMSDVDAGYTEGELKVGEYIEIVFNAYVD